MPMTLIPRLWASSVIQPGGPNADTNTGTSSSRITFHLPPYEGRIVCKGLSGLGLGNGVALNSLVYPRYMVRVVDREAGLDLGPVVVDVLPWKQEAAGQRQRGYLVLSRIQRIFSRMSSGSHPDAPSTPRPACI